MIREEDRMRDIFIAGNWKMNLSCEAAMQYARDFWPPEEKGLITAVAVPFTMLESLEEGLEGSSLLVFAQNMHYEDSGAFTGEISASMLKELGTDGSSWATRKGGSISGRPTRPSCSRRKRL